MFSDYRFLDFYLHRYRETSNVTRRFAIVDTQLDKQKKPRIVNTLCSFSIRLDSLKLALLPFRHLLGIALPVPRNVNDGLSIDLIKIVLIDDENIYIYIYKRELFYNVCGTNNDCKLTKFVY